MRYWPYEESSTPGRKSTRRVKRMCNGTVNGVRWAVMGVSSVISGCNGYAQIPWEGHPWTGCTNYHDLDVTVHGGLTYGPLPEFDLRASTRDLIDATADTEDPFVFPAADMLPTMPETTFADVGGWIGFDTSHGSDRWTDEELARIGLERDRVDGFEWPLSSLPYDVMTWTLDMVVAVAQGLADQISEVGLTARGCKQ